MVYELLRRAAWAEGCRPYHYRDRDGREVDLVLDGPAGVVGVEIKAAPIPRAADARHLSYLAGSSVIGGSAAW